VAKILDLPEEKVKVVQVQNGGGLALGADSLASLIGGQIVDNAGAREIKRYNFLEDGSGFVFRFYQNTDTNAYWRHIEGSKNKYTVVKAKLDIQPIKVKIKTL